MNTVAYLPNSIKNSINLHDDNLGLNCNFNSTFLNYDSQNQAIILNSIKKSICKIALGIQNCLYLSNLLDNNNCGLNYKQIELLMQYIDLQQHQQFNAKISIREFIQLTFSNLGIEVMYSGKNQHEKGVIIDVDEELAQKWGLNLATLKQGQTVVKLTSN